jgi:hypothetical protein
VQSYAWFGLGRHRHASTRRDCEIDDEPAKSMNLLACSTKLMTSTCFPDGEVEIKLFTDLDQSNQETA